MLEADLAVDPTLTNRLNKDDHYRVFFPFVDQVDDEFETAAPNSGTTSEDNLTYDRFTSPAEGIKRIRQRDRQKQGTKVNVLREIKDKAN